MGNVKMFTLKSGWIQKKMVSSKQGKTANLQVKEINRKDDHQQFQRYIRILGEERMPSSLSAFQKLKYEAPEEYEKLKDHVFIQNNFNRGIWKDEVNFEKQKRHMQSTVGVNKSYFYDDVDVARLYNKYKMTGKFRRKNGFSENNYELIDFHNEENLGIDIYTNKAINGFTVHYSKTGSHLIPTYHGKE
ncbi:polymorphic toxin type 50 domain-containing protein [Peptoniphilus sp. KCTC 25270]|uniref:polymorphic toxin type 50 domain-containing protein n=1 Tax=Peptoniphilus sp. KCTC 25270 TaxID=2897414 RepID=UPI001E4B2206|nr:polymorphic toxin type 50 domain-containing protein [Peptoniphilus sp. KCTC 25270]MCD1147294.1 polymorphic toxin type 50 domain-containing protein [Peptoniphilus sp. KCTC 25270]